MKEKIMNNIDDAVRVARKRRLKKRIVAFLCVVTILCTSLALRLEGTTLERIETCGKTAHTHNEACLNEAGQLACGLEEHTHTDACYQQTPRKGGDSGKLDAPIVDRGVVMIGDDEDVDIVDEVIEDGDSETIEDAVDESYGVIVGDSADAPVYNLNGDSHALLSDIAAAALPELKFEDIDDAGEVDGDEQPASIAVERVDGDYRVTALRNFIDDDRVELAVFAKNDAVYVVRLMNGIELAQASDDASDEGSGDAEQTEDGKETEVDKTPDGAEQGTDGEPTKVGEQDKPSEENEDNKDDEQSEENEDNKDDEQSEDDEDNKENEQSEDGEDNKDNEQSEENGDNKDDEQSEENEDNKGGEQPEDNKESEQSEEGEDNKENEQSEENEENKDDEQSEEGEENKESEQSEEGEDNKESEQSEDGEDNKENEQSEEDEDNKEDEGDNKESEESEEDNKDDEEQKDDPDADAHDDAKAPLTYTAEIDAAEFDAPFSLNALMALARAEAEASLDIEYTQTADEVPDTDADETENEASEDAEEPAKPNEADAEPEIEWHITFDEALFTVEQTEDDWLFTPVDDFDAATITVEVGDTYVLTLTHYALPVTYPAQSFEAHTDGMVVYVTAAEGAFPENTTMAVAPIYDETTLQDIAGTVEDDTTAVRHVHAVDITFYDAKHREIEPLIPISVVMDVETLKQSQDAVVVHMDSDGNTEVVEQTDADEEAPAPETAVAFDAENFSVYAVVITERYISADGQTWNIQVTYGSNAGIPEGAALEVRELEGDEYWAYREQTAELLDDRFVRAARFFDIGIVADGVRVQPGAAVEVKVTMESLDGDVQAVHFGDAPEVIQVAQDGEALVFDARSFSVYGIVSTVDFSYTDNGVVHQFSFCPGEDDSAREIPLYALLLSLDSDIDVDNVEAVSLSSGSTLEITGSKEAGWKIKNDPTQTPSGTLTLTLAGGGSPQLAINIGQGQIQQLDAFLEKVEFYDSTNNLVGSSESPDDMIVKPGQTYTLEMVFSEDENKEPEDGKEWQFTDTGIMRFVLPDDVRLGYNKVDTVEFDIVMGKRNTLSGNKATYRPDDGHGHACIDVEWNMNDTTNYTLLTYSPRATFTLRYNGTTVAAEEQSKPIAFAQGVFVDVIEDPNYTLALGKTSEVIDVQEADGQGNTITKKRIKYTVTVTAEGNAHDVQISDTMGSALTYVYTGSTPGMTFNPAVTYSELEQSASGFSLLIDKIEHGQTVTITYYADVNFSKLHNGEQSITETTRNTVKAFGVDGEIASEATTDLKGKLNFLQMTKKMGGLLNNINPDEAWNTDTHYIQDENGKYLWGDNDTLWVRWSVVYNPEQLINVEGATLTDEIYTGAASATFFETSLDNDGNFVKPFEVRAFAHEVSYNKDTGDYTTDPLDGEGILIPVEWKAGDPDENDPVGQYAYYHDYESLENKLFSRWSWTIPSKQDSELYEESPYTYVITYYTRVEHAKAFAGFIANRAKDDIGDLNCERQQILPGIGPGYEIKINKRVVDHKFRAVTKQVNGKDVPSYEVYTQWELTFDRRSFNLMSTVVEDTLPYVVAGGTPYADSFIYTDEFPVEVSTLVNTEVCVVETDEHRVKANDTGVNIVDASISSHRVVFRFFKNYVADGNNGNVDGLYGYGDDDTIKTIHIKFWTKSSADWLDATIRGEAPLQHWNHAHLIQDGHEANVVAYDTPERPPIIEKTSEKVGTWTNAGGITLPIFRYTLTLKGLTETAFTQNNGKIVIHDEFALPLTHVTVSELNSPTAGTTVNLNRATGGSDETLVQVSPENEHTWTPTITSNSNGLEITIDQDDNMKRSVTLDNKPSANSELIDQNHTQPETYSAYGEIYELSYYLALDHTTIKQMAQDMADGKKTFEEQLSFNNKATWEFQTETISGTPEDQEAIDYVFNPVQKSVIYKPGNAQYNDTNKLAKFIIVVNPLGLELNHGERYKLEDTYTDMAVDFQTVTFEPDNLDIEWSYHSNKGTFWIPDETAVTITYEGWPVGTRVQDVHFNNEVWLNGKYHDQAGSDATLDATHEGTAASYRIRLFKFANDNMGQPLSGAVFQLFENDDSGKMVPMRYVKAASNSHADESDWATAQTRHNKADFWDDEARNKANFPTPENHAANDYIYFVTGSDGFSQIMLSQSRDGVALKKNHQYYLKEVLAPEGYIAEDVIWKFIIGENDDWTHYIYSDDSVMQVSNASETRSLTLHKTFNADNANFVLNYDDHQKDVAFEIRGTNSGRTVYLKTVTCDDFKIIGKTGEYQLVLADLPAGTYTVKELYNTAIQHLPLGIQMSSSVSGTLTETVSTTVDGTTTTTTSTTTLTSQATDASGNTYFVYNVDANHSAEATFTNTYTNTTAPLKIEKAWSPQDASFSPTSAEFAVYADGVKYNLSDVEGGNADGNVVLSQSNNWTVTLNLPEYKTTDENGTQRIVWTVEEVAAEYALNGETRTVSGGYLSEHFNINVTKVDAHTITEGETTTNVPTTVTVTNTLNALVNVKVDKTWSDGANAHANDTAYFDLYRTTSAIDSTVFQTLPQDAVLVAENIALNAANGWVYSETLEKAATGNPYHYFAVERSVAGYTTAYALTSGITVKVKMTGQTEQIHFDLSRTTDTSTVPASLVLVASGTLNAQNHWTYVDSTLPKADGSNNLYHYYYKLDGDTKYTEVIPEDWQRTAITNTASADKGTLKITKAVTGVPETLENNYKFTLENSGKYYIEDAENPGHLAASAQQGYITVPAGSTGVTFTDVLPGTYVLTEATGTDAEISGYTLNGTTIAVNNGTPVDGALASVTVTGSVVTDVVVTNAYEKIKTSFKFGKLWVVPDKTVTDTLEWPDETVVVMQVRRRIQGAQTYELVGEYTITKGSSGIVATGRQNDPALTLDTSSTIAAQYNHYTFLLDGNVDQCDNSGNVWEYYAVETDCYTYELDEQGQHITVNNVNKTKRIFGENVTTDSQTGTETRTFDGAEYGYADGIAAHVVTGLTEAVAVGADDYTRSAINRLDLDYDFEIPVQKLMDGRDMTGTAYPPFWYKLYDMSGAAVQEDGMDVVAKGGTDGKAVFNVKELIHLDELKWYSQPKELRGKYIFWVKEQRPGMLTDAQISKLSPAEQAKLNNWQYTALVDLLVRRIEASLTEEGQAEYLTAQNYTALVESLTDENIAAINTSLALSSGQITKEQLAILAEMGLNEEKYHGLSFNTSSLRVELDVTYDWVKAELKVTYKYTGLDPKDPAPESVIVKNTYNTGEVQLTVTKHWADASNQDGYRKPAVFTVNATYTDDAGQTKTPKDGEIWFLVQGKDGKLYKSIDGKRHPDSNGKDTNTVIDLTTYTITVSARADNVTAPKVRLPKYYEGHEITYTLTEQPIEHYTAGAITRVSGASNSFEVTNTHTPEKINVSLEKCWAGKAPETNDKITVRLKAAFGGTELSSDNIATYVASHPKWAAWQSNFNEVELSSTNKDANWTSDGNTLEKWRYSWNNLPRFAPGETGAKITYTVEEVATSIPNGYVTESDNGTGTAEADETNSQTITNTYQDVDISIQKQWDDDSNRDGLRNNNTMVTMTLSATVDGESVNIGSLTSANPAITLTSANATQADDNIWASTQYPGWKGLPKYYQGKAVTYTVTETVSSALTGYKAPETTSTDADNGNHSTSARTIKNSHDIYTTQLTLTKKWDDDYNRDGLRPSPVDFLRNNVVLKATLTDGGNPVTLTIGDDLKLYNGNERFKDAAVSITGSNAYDAASGQVATENYVITFSNLPRRNNGFTIVYAIEETAVANYVRYNGITNGTESASDYVAGDSNMSVTIDGTVDPTDGTQNNLRTAGVTNKLDMKEITLSITKEWEHGGNNGTHPTTAQVRLNAKSAQTNQAIDLTDADTIALWTRSGYGSSLGTLDIDTSRQDMGTITLTLPKYRPGSVSEALIYSIEEVLIPDAYVVQYTGNEVNTTNLADNAQNSVNIKNLYQDMKIEATKVWDDAHDQDGQRKFVYFKLRRLVEGKNAEEDVAVNTSKIRVVKNDTDVTDSDLAALIVNDDGTVLVKVEANEGIKVIYEELPAWSNNKKISYRIVEVLVTGEDALTGYTTPGIVFDYPDYTNPADSHPNYTLTGNVTNTHTPAARSAAFTKVWNNQGLANNPMTAAQYKTWAETGTNLELYARAKNTNDTLVKVGVDEDATDNYPVIDANWRSRISVSGNTAGGDYAVTVSGLPKYRPRNLESMAQVELEYFLVESGSITNYQASYASGANASESGTITNILDTGSLVINKTVVSDLAADSNVEFSFTLTASPAITKSYAIAYSGGSPATTRPTTISFSNGTATLSLTKGETATITGLPVGVTYTVTEAQETNFDTPKCGFDSETLTARLACAKQLATKDQSIRADFENTRSTSDLVVSKIVHSTVQDDKDYAFKFVVTLNDTTINKSYSVEKSPAGANDPSTVQFTNGVSAEIELKHGESMTIKNLPVTVGYTLSEIIDGAEATNAAKFSRSAFPTGTIAQNETASASITNTRNTVKLTLNKTLSHAIPDDDGDIFYFDVQLTGEDGKLLALDANAPIVVASGSSIWTLPAKSTDSAALNASYPLSYNAATGSIVNVPVVYHGDGSSSTEIRNLPTGSSYTVTESNDGVTSTTWGNIQKNATTAENDTRTDITANVSATFNNNRKTGSLEVTKSVTSPVTQETSNDTYPITVTLVTKGNTSLTGTAYGNYAIVDAASQTTASGTVNLVNGSQTFALKHGDKLTITDIPTDVKYTVTETLTGNQLTNFNAPDITYPNEATHEIAAGATKSVSVKNERKTGSLQIGKTVVSNVPKDNKGSATNPQHYFLFKVVLTGSAIDTSKLTYPSNVTWESGNVAYIWLGDDETARIDGLPYGYTYTVTEVTDATGVPAAYTSVGQWEPTYYANFTSAVTDDGTGSVPADTSANPAVVSFTNTRKVGHLTIEKTGVTNDIPDDSPQTFYFDVELKANNEALILNDTGAKQIKWGGTSEETATALTETMSANAPYYDNGTIRNLPVQWTKGGTNNAVTLYNIPQGTTYTVTETVPTNFETPTYTYSDTPQEIAGGATQTVSVANTRKTGALAITKSVSSPVTTDGTTRAYPISIKLETATHAPVGGTYSYTTINASGATVASDTATFDATTGILDSANTPIALKHGETIKITGIPTDVVYTVTEIAPENFTNAIVDANDTHKIKAAVLGANNQVVTDNTSKVTVTNTRKTGVLSITKAMVSDISTDKGNDVWFWFKIEIPNADDAIDTKLNYGSDVSFVSSSVGYIKLNTGNAGTVTISGLPVGVTYRLTEIDDATTFAEVPQALIPNGYTFNSDYVAKFDTSWTGGTTGRVKELTVAESTQANPVTTAVTCTNKRKTGQLTLHKNLNNAIAGDDAKQFVFDIQLIGDDGATIQSNATGDIKVGENAAVFTLDTADNEYKIKNVQLTTAADVVITGIPVGTTCIVTEGASPDANIDAMTVSGSINVTVDNTNTLTGGSAESLSFTNSRKTGNLVIQKTVESRLTYEQTAPYKVQVELKAPLPVATVKAYTVVASGSIVNADDDSVAVDNNVYTVTFDEDNKATLYVRGGQTLTIQGIPTDVRYAVTEIAGVSAVTSIDLADFTTAVEDGDGAAVSGDRTVAAGNNTTEIVNARKTGSLTIGKQVTSSIGADDNVDFLFRVTALSDIEDGAYASTFVPLANVDTQYSGGYPDNVLTFIGNTAYIWLKHNETATAAGLPSGCAYTVTEVASSTDSDFTSYVAGNTVPSGSSFPTVLRTYLNSHSVSNADTAKFITSWVKAGTVSASSANNADDPTFDSSDATGDAANANVITEAASTVTFTNTRRTGELKLTKTLQNALPVTDSARQFTYDVVLVGENTQLLDMDVPITVNGTAVTTTVSESVPYYVSDSGTKKITIHNVPVTSNNADGTTISGIPVGTAFTVTEETFGANDPFELVSITVGNNQLTPDEQHPNPSATDTIPNNGIATSGNYTTAAFTNARKTTGSLQISKTVSSTPITAETTAYYDMQVTLRDEVGQQSGSVNGAYLITGHTATSGDSVTTDENDSTKQWVTFTNDQATIKVKHGETVTISGLPVDAKVTVQELNNDNFVTKYNNAVAENCTGTVTLGGTLQVAVDNVRKTGTLTVTKTVVSDVDADKASTKKYRFRVELPAGTVIDPTKITGMTFTNGTVAEFELASGETATATGLPTDITYTVTEYGDTTDEQTHLGKFNTTWGVTTTDGASQGEGGDDGESGETPATPVPTGLVCSVPLTTPNATTAVTCTNTRKTGTLKLTKNVNSPLTAEKSAYYYITVNLSTTEGAESGQTVPVKGTYTVNVHSKTGEPVEAGGSPTDSYTTGSYTFTNGSAVIPVQGGSDNYVEITGLPVDVLYEVSETAHTPGEGQQPNGFDAAIFTPSVSYVGDSAENPPTTHAIVADGTKAVTVTNTRIKVPVAIKKVDSTSADLSQPLSGAQFALYKVNAFTDAVSTLTPETITPNVSTGADGMLSLGDLSPGQKYLLVETHAPNGFNMLAKAVEIEVLADASKVEYNTYLEGGEHSCSQNGTGTDESGNTVVLTVPNSPGVVLPSTGGSGTMLYTVSGLTLILLALALLLRRRSY